MRVLVVNAGSSSLKLTVVEPDDSVALDVPVQDWTADDRDAVADALRGAGRVDAVGHRVVHGGAALRSPVRVDAAVERQIAALTPLAPLHQPRALAGIRATRAALPDVPAVACFDTSYHHDLPERAATYALPGAWRERWGLRRFGFHGLSHAYAARRSARLLGPVDRAGELRVVSCHLGAGASLCASRCGPHGPRSVDTTMGFTPLEGLVMASRSGTVDPGLVLWLITEAGLPAGRVRQELESSSGLAGLTGGSGDMRDVLAARAAGDPSAGRAFDVYIHRLVKEVAAMTGALGGLDALVFTGGVGEHAGAVRTSAAVGLGFLGVAVDPERNARPRPGDGEGDTGDVDISAAGAAVRTLIVTSREDLEVARETRKALC